jgi:cyanate permease
MVDSGVIQGQALPAGEIPPYEQRYRWVMLALGWMGYFTFGVVSFSLGPLVTPIIEDLGISYSQMGIILGAWPLTYVVVAAIGGAIIDRWGIRRSIFAGLILIGLSAGLRFFADSFAAMFLCVALFGLGGPMLSIGSPKMISLWFRGRSRGTAVGIYTTGPWIGGALSLSVMNSVIMPLTGYSWRVAFGCYGLGTFVIALVWWFLARDAKQVEADDGAGITTVFRNLIGLRNVQLVLITGFFSFAVGHGFTNWLPRILEGGGLAPSVAGFASAIPIWVGVVLVLVVPRLIMPHFRGRFIALVAVVTAAGIMVTSVTTGPVLVMGLVLYGLAYMAMPLLVLILMDLPEVGSRYMGAASGMFFCIAELGGFFGPLLVGAVKDLGGGFLTGAYLLAGLSLIRVVFALLVKTKPASP